MKSNNKKPLPDPSDPLVLLAAKQTIDKDTSDALHRMILICVDAAQRSAATVQLTNCLTEHMAMIVSFWGRRGNRRQYDLALVAWKALSKAAARPTELLDLSTTEYKAVRAGIKVFLRNLHTFPIGEVILAQQKALDQFYGPGGRP